MLEDRVSRIAFMVSLLLHAGLVSPVWDTLSAGDPVPASSSRAEEPMMFRFVDSQPEEAEPSDRPDELLSTTDARAAQEEAPVDLDEGAAYSEGPLPVPATPRTPGSPAGSGASPPAERPTERTGEVAETRDGAGPSSGVDPRLALPLAAPRLRVGPAAPPGSDEPPVPEVDSRLTRASAGSDFSMNTRAWKWGPYMERLKRRIEERISPPAAFYYGTAAWVTRVRFRIAPDGRLVDTRLLDHRGVNDLQYVAMDAIEDAADYEPLPPDFPEPYLEITAGFYFNVMRDR